MKVKLEFPFLTLKGKRDESVFYTTKKSNCIIMREYVVPETTDNNKNFKNKSTNLGLFYNSVSELYQYDMSTYARSYNLETMDGNCFYHAYNIFITMMYALARAYPDIDLATLTPEQAVEDNLPIVTIAQAIEAGLLSLVPDYHYLNHQVIE
jgi:hypothetical protein